MAIKRHPLCVGPFRGVFQATGPHFGYCMCLGVFSWFRSQSQAMAVLANITLSSYQKATYSDRFGLDHSSGPFRASARKRSTGAHHRDRNAGKRITDAVMKAKKERKKKQKWLYTPILTPIMKCQIRAVSFWTIADGSTSLSDASDGNILY